MSYHAALEGMLVVTVEQAVAAPYCTSRLADAGARVIKVERPTGDFARYYDTTVAGESAYFVWLNRGKESLCLDLKRETDQALLRRIAEQADVFVQNLAPGAMARLGLAAHDLRAANPRLITVDISGYGPVGAYETMKAYDLLVQCESGLAAITGTPDAPGRVGVSVCDIACGMYAYSGILQALIARGRTGQGQGLEVSLFSAIADWMAVPLLQSEGGVVSRRAGLNHPTIAPYGAYACQNDDLVVFSVQSESEWQRLCSIVLQDAALLEDERFADNEARLQNRAALDELIHGVLARLSRDEVIARLADAGMAYGAVRGLEDLPAHPALRRVPMSVGDQAVGMVAPPVSVAGDAITRLPPVPDLGAHTDQLRAEFAAD